MDPSRSPFIHSHAICETAAVGAGTRVWAFAHLLPGCRIGGDCNICDHVFIENDVTVGDRVTIKCGVQLWDGVRIADDVFIGPNATFTNDSYPRSKKRPEDYLQTFVEYGASIGANATILPGIRIGAHAMVGAGAVVTRSVPPNSIVCGNPARIMGYSGVRSRPRADPKSATPQPVEGIKAPPRDEAAGSRMVDLPSFIDMRGKLSVLDLQSSDLFSPVRCFFVYGVPSAKVRGEHAHAQCEQLLICTQGTVRIMTESGGVVSEYKLTAPTQGLYIAPMVWAAQFDYSADAVVMVLASHSYDESDYIRDYHAWRKLEANVAKS